MSTAGYDTLIIGGGQAGLALGYHLRRAGLRFAILDAHRRVGDAWRHRHRAARPAVGVVDGPGAAPAGAGP